MILCTIILIGYCILQLFSSTIVSSSLIDARYNAAKECLSRSPFMTNERLQKLQYRDDAEAHYYQLLNATSIFRNIKPHAAAGYRGPWIENYFNHYFIKKPFYFFQGFVPLFIQWTDIHVHGMNRNNDSRIPSYSSLLEFISSTLRDDLIYIAVHQDDQGFSSKLAKAKPNILTISAGGFGHIPMPLIKGEHLFSEPPSRFLFDVSYFGTVAGRPARAKILSEFERCCRQVGLNCKISSKSDSWLEQVMNSKYVLVPRGFGRTSYFMSEIIQLGRIPVYLYDDVDWSPYQGSNLSVSHLGYSAARENLCNLVTVLKSETFEVLQERLRRIKSAREDYLYRGVLMQIEKLIRWPEYSLKSQDVVNVDKASLREHSQLKCQTMPTTEH